MNSQFRWWAGVCVAILMAAAGAAQAQRAHIGYVYPAGGKRGTVVRVAVGGENLRGTVGAYVSGNGVRVKVLDYVTPSTLQRLENERRRAQQARATRRAKFAAGEKKDTMSMARRQAAEAFGTFADKQGMMRFDSEAYEELREKLANPKRQLNPQIAETVILEVKLSDYAKPGQREVRLRTAAGVTNPLYFHVGQCREHMEREPNDKKADDGVLKSTMKEFEITVPESLPVVVNGQIMPGDVDRFRFQADKGTRLVAAVSARKLIPYLADAVPGWFQATLTLRDAKGNEVAYTDDFRFHPDPVIYYEIPADGEYIIEIKDAIFRGREDFVYRIALGEVPYVTSIFPLGGRVGTKTEVKVQGWNLATDVLTLDATGKGPGVLPVSVSKGKQVSNDVPFALDTLPECLEAEPNSDRSGAQRVKLPIIVNGRIDRGGDWDIFRFQGHAGDEIVAEVRARRLGSPLDSILKLTDATGKQLAINDDHVDKGAGLTTHHADSRVLAKLPADGEYLVHLGDTQHKGSEIHGYRLRIGPRRPDFELRVVPSSIHASAGATIPITVFALRKDGFDGDIHINLKDPSWGFRLSGARVPTGQEKIRLTMTVPPTAPARPLMLHMEGRGTIAGQEVVRSAVPAEDRTQAFVYRHLLATDNWIVTVAASSWRSVPRLALQEKGPVKLTAGQASTVRLSAPKSLAGVKIELALSEPPEGLAVKKVSRDGNVVALLLSVDGKKIKAGLKGNLILNAAMHQVIKSRDGKPTGQTRRVSLGTLPAIPFEIAAAPPGKIVKAKPKPKS